VKKKILDQLISKANEELKNLQEALEATKSFATDQEFKAESKYDTRSLEASYLASAEAKRVEELNQEIQLLEEVDPGLSQKLGEISIGAMVELSCNNQVRNYFLIPTAGGTLLECNGQSVLVVSVFSPIGNELMGLKKGDEFEVETPKGTRNYKVISFT
jgi:transcription elongation GreA/GreB family factor